MAMATEVIDSALCFSYSELCIYGFRIRLLTSLSLSITPLCLKSISNPLETTY